MDAKTALLVRIAQLYYEKSKSQAEIAELCQIERSRVSRLLMQARNLGIVQFHVIDPSRVDEDLGGALQERFALSHAVVFSALDVSDAALKRGIGLVAAEYVSSVLKEGDILAVSWGDTIYHTVQNLSVPRPVNIVVVPALGGSGLISPAYQVNLLAQRVAEQTGGRVRSLYAPAFVESKEVRDSLLESPDIQPIVEMWQKATAALVGIGKSPFQYKSENGDDLQFGQFYLRRTELRELRAAGVVGDINARFIDTTGAELAVSIHDRVIGMALQELQRVPKVIAVAGGASKVRAIRAALRGGHIDVLATDDKTAVKLLTEEE